MPPAPVLILDNGGSSIKVGLSTSDADPRIISNSVVKPKGGSGSKLFIGHEIESCKDFFGLYYRRPFEKGILTDWDVEKAVWDKTFSSDCMNLTSRSLSLLVTEPPFNLPVVQETYDQLVFEEYQFKSYFRCPPAALAPYGGLFQEPNQPAPECSIIVDSGFSFTHVIPIMSGSIVWGSVRRIDVGGKLLTNHLKEIVSFRHWDMMEHTYVMNEVKEKCCYVSNSFAQDLETTQVNSRKNPIVQEYVLPDFSANRPGYIRKGPNATPRDPSPAEVDTPPISVPGMTPPPARKQVIADDAVLYMSNERFTVPEVLFHPSDVGLNQDGLPRTIAASIASLPEDLQGLFWANIGLIGGNFNIPGIETRLETELRAFAPPEYKVGLYKANDPITAAYHAAQKFTSTQKSHFASLAVTKAEYEEGGSNVCLKKFKKANLAHRESGERDHSSAGEGEADDDAMDVDGEEDPQTSKASRAAKDKAHAEEEEDDEEDEEDDEDDDGDTPRRGRARGRGRGKGRGRGRGRGAARGRASGAGSSTGVGRRASTAMSVDEPSEDAEVGEQDGEPHDMPASRGRGASRPQYRSARAENKAATEKRNAELAAAAQARSEADRQSREARRAARTKTEE